MKEMAKALSENLDAIAVPLCTFSLQGLQKDKPHEKFVLWRWLVEAPFGELVHRHPSTKLR